MKADFLTTFITLLSAVTTAQSAVSASTGSIDRLPARHVLTLRNTTPNQCRIIDDEEEIPCYSGPGEYNFPIIEDIAEGYDYSFGVSCYDVSDDVMWYYIEASDCFVESRLMDRDCEGKLPCFSFP